MGLRRVIPTQGTTGGAASEEMMYSILSHMSGGDCKPGTALHEWQGVSKGDKKAAISLELHENYLMLKKTSGCCGCGKSETYTMLLKDIEHLEVRRKQCFAGLIPEY